MAQENEATLRKNLKEMGGRYWERGVFRRVYFNKGTLLSIMGVDINQVKELAKTDISGVGPEKKLLNALDCTKVYYDLVHEEWSIEFGCGVTTEHRLFVSMAAKKLEEQLKEKINTLS